MKGKFWIILATAVLLTLFSTNWVWGFSSGIAGFSGNPATGGNTCLQCHNTGQIPTVTISGPTVVAVNDLVTYMLIISGGQEVAGGLDVSATDGVLDILPGATDTQKLGDEITHTEPKTAAEDGTVTFSFQWQAPAAEVKAILYGAGNSVDLMSGNLGDAPGTATLAITVIEFTQTLYLPTVMRSE